MPPITKPILWLTLCLVLWATSICAQESDEQRLGSFKALFLYNFTHYIKWSEPDTSGTFIIAVLGESSAYASLLEIAAKRKVDGLPLRIKTAATVEELMPCHLLYFTSEHVGELENIKRHMAGKSALLVADVPGLARLGVGISFVLQQGKLKFEISQQALERAGLKASSQLLKLAILTDEQDDGG